MFDTENIVHNAEQVFGRSFNDLAFHAYDDNQMPIGAPLKAVDYVNWLNSTYNTQPIETLRSISNQYAVAVQSAKNSPGILPEALGNLVLSGAVFQALTQTAAEHEAMPASVSNLSHSDDQAAHTPVDMPPRAAAAATPTERADEEKTTLLHLRDELVESLHISSPFIDHAELLAHITDMVEERKKALDAEHAQHRMSQEGVDQEVQKMHRTLMQKALQLQSINARLGNSEVADTRSTPTAATPTTATTATPTSPLPSTESLENLRAEEQKLITEIRTFDDAVQHSSLHVQQLHRIQTHIQIVEQLLHIIREETTE